MTAITPDIDPLAESQRLIAALERHAADLPFAAEHLALHRPMYQTLVRCKTASDSAVAAWRAALAQRWEWEVRGRRVYKQLQRLYVEHYGSDEHPRVQLVTSSEDDVDSSPSKLLTDLRRIQNDLTLNAKDLPFAERIHELTYVCARLEQAIAESATCETARRYSVVERRMAQEAYLRARNSTQGAIRSHYGEQISAEMHELLS
jgi:hypothetical protein